MTCALDSFESLTSNERDKLFARDVLRDIDQPIDVNGLGQAFAEEILANIGVQFFEEADCATQEHPGKVRTPAVSRRRVSAAAGARLSCQRPAHGELRPAGRTRGLHT